MTNSNEYSFTVPASKIGGDDYNVSFDADERALALLAKRLNILSVEKMAGTATLRRQSDGMTIYVRGTIDAAVTQACVTTLEPVPDTIRETFEGWFLDESQATSFTRALKKKQEEEGVGFDLLPVEDDEFPMISEQEEPEPLVGGLVDVGELAAQYLSLALNPYPHSEKALAEGPLGEAKPLEKASPVEALKDWKAK